MIEVDDVVQAAMRLRGHAHRTPLVTSHAVDEAVGAHVIFKCEQFQRTGAFKFRGAHNAIASLSPEDKARGVFAFSSGNHAQAVALAAQRLQVAATILMPLDAPAGKMAATRGYGAEIITYDRYKEDRFTLAMTLAAERGLPVIPPFDNEDVMAGQGTVALEVLDEVTEPIDLFVTPLGGGGLLSGCATVVKARSPATRMIGIEPEAGDDFRQSIATGERVRIDVPQTIADGLQTEQAGVHTFPVVQSRVDAIEVVSDQEIIAAMRLLFERAKLVVEPSGAVGLAALLSGRIDVAGQRIVVVLSGGNVGADQVASLFAQR